MASKATGRDFLDKFDLRYLRFFVAVAEAQNFSRAAERLNTVQPSLSHQIRRLEEIVGTPLLHRGARKITLTPAGTVFLEQAREIIQAIEYAVRAARRASAARPALLRIGVVSGIEITLFAEILPMLRAHFHRLEIKTFCDSEVEIAAALKSGLIDIALGLSKGKNANYDPLFYPRVYSFEICIIVPDGHVFANEVQLSIGQLAGYPLVRPAPDKFPMMQQLTEAISLKHGVELNVAMDTDGIMPTISAVQAGIGYAFVPEKIRSLLPPTIRVIRLASDSALDFPVNLSVSNNADPFIMDVVVASINSHLARC